MSEREGEDDREGEEGVSCRGWDATQNSSALQRVNIQTDMLSLPPLIHVLVKTAKLSVDSKIMLGHTFTRPHKPAQSSVDAHAEIGIQGISASAFMKTR